MGEVYRARDPRLGREVAIKVLPASFSADPDRLRRFEQEARAAGVLNHPNITAVYDVGQHDGAPYVVQELLEGETLRAALAGGALSARRAIDYATQIAQRPRRGAREGHRPPGPEARERLRHEGRPRQDPRLRPGEADAPEATLRRTPPVCRPRRRAPSPASSWERSATCRPSRCAASPPTRAATSSPSARSSTRCCRGGARSAGTPPPTRCRRSSKEDPPDLSLTNQDVSPGLERIVRHCLEKNPEQRFHSAHDVAFDLEALSAASGPAMPAPALGAGVSDGRLSEQPSPSSRSPRRPTSSAVATPRRRRCRSNS